MWTAQKISANTAKELQIGAGILVKNFDITSPTEPADEDIICATSGDFTIESTHDDSDLFDDINNAPTGTKEGRQIDSWTHRLAIEALSITDEMIKRALGASEVVDNGGIAPRRQYKGSDFETITWLGDMLDDGKLLVVVMENAISTGGFSLTTTNKGKGRLGLEFTALTSISNPDIQPMTYYIIEKQGGVSGLSANLSALAIGDSVLTPAFAPNTTVYFTSTENASDNITATPDDDNALVSVVSSDATISDNTATWGEGSNVVAIHVQNSDGGSVSEKDYIITVIKSNE